MLAIKPRQRLANIYDHGPNAGLIALAQLHLDGHGHGHRHRRLGRPVASVRAAVAPATGPVLETQYISPFGANQYTPSITALSALNYQPIPLSVALNEYLPPPGFRARLYSFNHPGKKIRGQPRPEQGPGQRHQHPLAARVFTRGVFHAQKIYTYTHKTAKVGIRRSGQSMHLTSHDMQEGRASLRPDNLLALTSRPLSGHDCDDLRELLGQPLEAPGCGRRDRDGR